MIYKQYNIFNILYSKEGVCQDGSLDDIHGPIPLTVDMESIDQYKEDLGVSHDLCGSPGSPRPLMINCQKSVKAEIRALDGFWQFDLI